MNRCIQGLFNSVLCIVRFALNQRKVRLHLKHGEFLNLHQEIHVVERSWKLINTLKLLVVLWQYITSLKPKRNEKASFLICLFFLGSNPGCH